MPLETATLLPIAGAGLVAAFVIRLRDQRQQQATLVGYRLRFAHTTEVAAVENFVAGLTALPPADGLAFGAAVTFEIVATADGIEHHLWAPRAWTEVITSRLRATLPDVRLTPVKTSGLGGINRAVELRLAGGGPLSVRDSGATSSSLLASLQPLRDGERFLISWTVAPTRTAHRSRRPTVRHLPRALRVLQALWRVADHQLDQGTVEALQSQFLVVGRVGVNAAHSARTGQLLRRLVAVTASVGSPRARLVPRSLPSGVVVARLSRRSLPLFGWPIRLSARELVALIGFPLGSPVLPGLRLGGCRQLPPSVELPRSGRVLLHATFPGAERAVGISPEASTSHIHVGAPTSAGKSTLLLNLARSDMAAGRGLIVVDGKGDLIGDCLNVVPADRVKDVTLLDPADDQRPVGLNLLAGSNLNPELVADQITGIFHHLFREHWGPRTDDVLRASLLTLVRQPGMTVVEVEALLTNDGFRRRLVAQITEPIALQPFWAWYDALGVAERAVVIAPLMNKLRAVLLRERLRNIVGQSRPSWSFDDVLARRQILLVSLAKGLIGEEAAALLGALVLARLWQATLGRAAQPPHQRHPVMVIVDEFQDYVGLPTSLGDMLAQARGLGVGLTLANQSLSQLPPALRQAVMANTRTKIAFALAADDARVLAKEFSPYLTAADLQGLGRYEVAARIWLGDHLAPPVTGVTLPPPEPTGQGDAARNWSRQRYGVDKPAVERAMRARRETGPGDRPIGSRRRAP